MKRMKIIGKESRGSQCGRWALFIASLTFIPSLLTIVLSLYSLLDYSPKGKALLQVKMKATTVSCFVIMLIPLLIVDANDKFNPMPTNEDSMCHSCLEASRKAEETLIDPKLFEKVNMVANGICQTLPTDLEAKCFARSSAYIDSTRLSLQELFHENSICKNTGICLNKLPSRGGLLEDANDCSTCRNAVKDLKVKLKQPKTRAKITETFIEYCEEADEKEEHCKQTVYKFVPLVLSKLDKLKPNTLCVMIGICGEEISI